MEYNLNDSTLIGSILNRGGHTPIYFPNAFGKQEMLEAALEIKRCLELKIEFPSNFDSAMELLALANNHRDYMAWERGSYQIDEVVDFSVGKNRLKTTFSLNQERIDKGDYRRFSPEKARELMWELLYAATGKLEF